MGRRIPSKGQTPPQIGFSLPTTTQRDRRKVRCEIFSAAGGLLNLQDTLPKALTLRNSGPESALKGVFSILGCEPNRARHPLGKNLSYEPRLSYQEFSPPP